MYQAGPPQQVVRGAQTPMYPGQVPQVGGLPQVVRMASGTVPQVANAPGMPQRVVTQSHGQAAWVRAAGVPAQVQPAQPGAAVFAVAATAPMSRQQARPVAQAQVQQGPPLNAAFLAPSASYAPQPCLLAQGSYIPAPAAKMLAGAPQAVAVAPAPQARATPAVPVEAAAPAEGAQPAKGRLPKKVYFMRHGTSMGNVTEEDLPDPLLTKLGEKEAKSWLVEAPKLKADVILVSPLRRTLQTACLAFGQDKAPMQLCRCARELGFGSLENSILSTEEQFAKQLKTLPRGDCVTGAAKELYEQPSDESDEASLAQLRQVLAARPEKIVALVCHWHVILDLTGVDTDNAELVECKMDRDLNFQVLSRRQPPYNDSMCQACSV